MKQFVAIAWVFLIFVACTKTEPVQSKISRQALIDNNYTLDEPKTICDSSSAQLAHAPWAKSGVQPPHLLIVKSSSGNEQEFSLGIDRSPDFLFRLSGISLGEHYFYYAHSRLLAYSCENKQLAEVPFVYPDQYQAQDAQSGMIRNLIQINSTTLQLELVDAGSLEFLVTPSQITQVREP